MEKEMLKKVVKGLKPGQQFKITYVSPIKSTAAFRDLSGGCTLGKMTGVTTCSGLKYTDIAEVKRRDEERAAKIAAGEAEPKRESTAKYNAVIPNFLYELEGHDDLYLNLYPTECWKDVYSTYCIFEPNGDIQAQYESWEDIRDYVLPSWVKQQENKKGPTEMPTIIRKKAKDIYDILV